MVGPKNVLEPVMLISFVSLQHHDYLHKFLIIRYSVDVLLASGVEIADPCFKFIQEMSGLSLFLLAGINSCFVLFLLIYMFYKNILLAKPILKIQGLFFFFFKLESIWCAQETDKSERSLNSIYAKKHF